MYKGHTLKSLALFLIYLLPNQLLAHGGVFVEDDLCVIQIGFFKAHFTIYQPEIAGNKEYCEDIPNTGTSLFILDYLHESLNTLPVDFRIIKNVTDHGRATTWQHLSAMNDLEQHTVYYQPDMVVLNGTLEAEYNFTETGHYVGIVTTRQPGNQKIYRAVFPFKVGVSTLGYLPLFIGLILLVELFYLYSNGTLQAWFSRIKHSP